MKKEKSFVKSGAVLVLSGVVVKLLSAVYRIPLTRMLGATQMGRYSSVFNIFMPFFALATGGITPCICHYTAQLKNKSAARHLCRRALWLYLPAGFAVTAAFVAFSAFYSRKMGDSIFFTGALVLCPSVVLAVAEAVCKGITQGSMDMAPTAKANVLESLSKTALGLGGVYFAVNIRDCCSAKLLVLICLGAVTAAAFVCTAYLIYATGKTMGAKGNGSAGVGAKQLLRLSLPIAASGLVVSLAGFFETAVCLPMVKKLPYEQIVSAYGGASFMGAGEISVYLFGIYQGMVLTIFNLAPAVTGSVATAVLPYISKVQKQGSRGYLQQLTDRLFKITALVGVGFSAFVFFWRQDIVQFLFSANSGQRQVAGSLIAIMVPCCVFACFTGGFNSLLNAHKRSDTVFKILVAASVVKCTVSGVLCRFAQINVKAFAVSAAVFYTIIFVLSIINVKKLGISFRAVKIFAAPLFSAAFSLAVTGLFSGALCCLPCGIKLVLCGIVFSLLYVTAVSLLGFTVDIRQKKEYH